MKFCYCYISQIKGNATAIDGEPVTDNFDTYISELQFSYKLYNIHQEIDQF